MNDEETMELLDDLDLINEESDDESIKVIFFKLKDELELDLINEVIDSLVSNTKKTPIAIKKLYNEIIGFDRLSIGYERQIDHNSRAILKKDGIDLVKTNTRGIFITPVYVWREFSIVGKFNNAALNNEYKFDFILNGSSYTNYPFSQMKSKIQERAYHGMRGKNIITGLLEDYADNATNISKEVKNQCGFLDEGWVLPDKYYFRDPDEIMKITINNIKQMCDINADPAKAINYFRFIYNMTTISNKDVVFAWILASPFMHVLKSILKIMPLMCLYGEQGKGKTVVSEFGVTKIFYTCDEIDMVDSIETKSRFCSALAGSSFPRAIDDCENLPVQHNSTIKSHTTTYVKFQRKDKNQGLSINKLLSSPILQNFNLYPQNLKDPASRDRIILLEIEILPQTKDEYKDLDWNIEMDKIPNGYIGKYIIDKTNDWNKEKLIEIMKEIKSDTNLSKRSNNIIRILKLGAKIAKNLFSIRLDLSNIEDIIAQSKNIGTEQLLDSIKHQAMQGARMANNEFFHPSDWVRLPVKCIKHKGIWNILLDTTRKTNVMRQYDSDVKSKDMTLPALHKIIRSVWKDVEHKQVKYKGKNDRYIVIPTKYIVGYDIDLIEWVNMTDEDRDSFEKNRNKYEAENDAKIKMKNDFERLKEKNKLTEDEEMYYEILKEEFIK